MMSIDPFPKLPGFKQVFSVNLKWGDMDAMRHVNNTRYFYYAESARLDFLLNAFPGLSGPKPETMKHGLALAYTDCEFKVSLTYPDSVVIGSAVSEINETEFWLRHPIYSTKLDCVAAESRSRMVHYDFEQGQRKIFSDEMLEVLEQYRL